MITWLLVAQLVAQGSSLTLTSEHHRLPETEFSHEVDSGVIAWPEAVGEIHAKPCIWVIHGKERPEYEVPPEVCEWILKQAGPAK